MGKKFIPVKMHEFTYKIYLENLVKIYKCVRKTALPVPPFIKKGVSRKASIDTVHEEIEGVASKNELY